MSDRATQHDLATVDASIPVKAVSWRQFLLLLLILALAVTLRVVCLQSRPLWFDEAFSWRLTSLPWWELLGAVARDNHPPLYFAVLKTWRDVGGAEENFLRVPSVWFSAVTVVLVFLFTRDIAGQVPPRGESRPRAGEAGLIAALLIAVSTIHIRWGWEMRMYSLGTALATASCWALWKAVLSPRPSPFAWPAFVAATVAFLYTHYCAILLLATQCLFVCVLIVVQHRHNTLGVFGARRFRGFAFAGASVLLAWVPWLPSFWRQKTQVQEEFWVEPLSWKVFFRTIHDLLAFPEAPDGIGATVAIPAVVVVVVLTALITRFGWVGRFVATMTIVPIALAAIVSSFLNIKIFEEHYLIFFHVFFVSGLAMAVTRLPTLIGHTVVLLVVMDGLSGDLQLLQGARPGGDVGPRAAASWINRHWNVGDRVVASSPMIYLPLLYYGVPSDDTRVWSRRRTLRHHDGAAVIGSDEMIFSADLERYEPGWIWYVKTTSWGNLSVPIPKQWEKIETCSFPEVYPAKGRVFVTLYRSAHADSGRSFLENAVAESDDRPFTTTSVE